MTCSSFLSSPSLFLCSHNRYAKNIKKKHRASLPMDSHRHENPNETDFYKRRAILVLGISSLPFLQLKTRAVESLVKEERDTKILEENQELRRQEAPSNPILSLLNVTGIIGSGVLGALYTLAQKEKTATEATIESLKNRLNEKEAAMVSMEKKFEKRLLDEQEERSKQIKRAKEDQLYLSNQLNLANSTISGLGKQLVNEKRFVEELKAQIGKLENDLKKAGEDNKMLEADLQAKLDSIEVLHDRINLLTLEIKDKQDNLQNLQSSLAEKESECNSLDFISKQTKADLTKANSEIVSLKEEVLKTKEELDSTKSNVDDLNMRVTSLVTERDDISRKLGSLQEDYNALKSSSEKKAASDADLLGKKEIELQQLQEKLGIAMNEVNSKQTFISDLTRERDDLRKLLEVEVNNVKNLKRQLQIMQETLETSRTEASDLSRQLEQSRKSCQELTSEISRIQAVFAEARESLKTRLKEATSKSKVLSDELTSVKKVSENTKDELRVVSDELAAMIESRESLKKELVDAYKKAERTANDLKEERNVVASLSKELEASHKQIIKDKQARQILETDLEEATKSLDELNKNVMVLSRDLDVANSKIVSLEADKDLLYKSLVEQKNIAKEARGDIEDADNLIMKLGKEKKSLETRGKKLEEELASAKGEILRLRDQMNSLKKPVNDVPRPNNVGSNAAVAVKKTRRRRSSSSSEVSDKE